MSVTIPAATTAAAYRAIAKTLTKRQIGGMKRIQRSPTDWCDGGRAGGTVSRMFDRMYEAGLVTKPPYRLTDYGRRVLEAHEAP